MCKSISSLRRTAKAEEVYRLSRGDRDAELRSRSLAAFKQLDRGQQQIDLFLKQVPISIFAVLRFSIFRLFGFGNFDFRFRSRSPSEVIHTCQVTWRHIPSRCTLRLCTAAHRDRVVPSPLDTPLHRPLHTALVAVSISTIKGHPDRIKRYSSDLTHPRVQCLRCPV
jgi:hypothetical protein